MNVLLNGPPEELEVDGKFYSIDADFRNCLAIMLAFEDERLNNFEKPLLMVKLLFNEQPENTSEAAKQAALFLNLGEEKMEESYKKPVYSFSHDAKLIRSAFKIKGIDLDKAGFLHWWDFISCFFELKDTQFNEIMGVRARLASGKASKEDKAYAQKNASVINIPAKNTDVKAADDNFMERYKKAKVRQGFAKVTL